MRKITPPQLLILSFLGAIALGSILLALPQATKGAGSLPLIDSIFTATSATCVTGLTVTDTGGTFTSFGKWVIFSLFQAGGLGIMTFSTLFAVLLGRKIGFSESDVVKSTLDRRNILGLKKLIGYILAITLTFELLGAAVLFLRWSASADWGVMLTLERAVFHAVSGFCNAGFSVFSDSLTRFRTDPVINLTMISLIFFGGIGFIVIMDLLGLFVRGRRKRRRKMSLQAKIALSVSFFLIIMGAAAIMLFEKDNLLQAMSWPEKTMASVFQSVTARTAGFNTIDTGQLTVPSQLVLSFLMFIGASPGSTGGGIKTCTFLVIVVTVVSMMKARRRAGIFGRSIPKQIVRESLSIFFLASGWIFIFTILLTFFEKGFASEGGLVKPMFEVFSAFGTVGLSTGITSSLSTPGKACIIATMFAGRVGPLTLALAVAFKERSDKYFFPEENIMVG